MLTHLRRSHGQDDTPATAAAPRTITLKRKSQSELGCPVARVARVPLTSRFAASAPISSAMSSKSRRRKSRKSSTPAARGRRARSRLRRVRKSASKAEKEAAVKAAQEAQREGSSRRARAPRKRRGKAAEKAAADAAEEKTRLEKAEADARARRTKEKAKPQAQGRAETRYGRKELHVAGDKSGRRKRKTPTASSRRYRWAAIRKHGFERPTAPVIHEVEIPGEHFGCRAGATHGDQRQRSRQGAVQYGRHGDDQPGHRSGHGDARRRGTWATLPSWSIRPISTRQLLADEEQTDRRRSAARAGCHDHGARRSRQDIAARLYSSHEGSGWRGRRYHAAYRRVFRRTPTKARSRSLIRRAMPRLRRCVRAVRRRRISSFSWLRLMTA